MKPRRVVYRVYEYIEGYKKPVPYALVYDDGSFKSLIFSREESIFHPPKKLIRESRLLTEKMWQLEFDLMQSQGSRWLTSISFRYCASQEENEFAYIALCALLKSGPPFHGYRIKYYGKGKPWIPNPDWSEGLRF